MSSKMENSILQAVRQKQAIQGVCFSWTAWGEDQRLLRQYWPNLLKSLSQACSSHSQRREGTEQISSVKNWFAGCLAGLHYLRPFPNMKWIPGRVKDSDYYVNYDYEMWGKVSGAERCGYYWEAAPSPFLLRLFVCCVCSFSCICSFVTFFLLFFVCLCLRLIICLFVLLFFCSFLVFVAFVPFLCFHFLIFLHLFVCCTVASEWIDKFPVVVHGEIKSSCRSQQYQNEVCFTNK